MLENIVNLTPHDIHLYGENDVAEGPLIVIPKSGVVARIASSIVGGMEAKIPGLPNPVAQVRYVMYGALRDIPKFEEGKFYIVSLPAALSAATALIPRNDLLAPYQEVRNERGEMIGCRYLQKIR